MTINSKVDGGHLGFMKIVGIAQTCLPGNQSRFVLEHIFISAQKTSLYSTFLGSENVKWIIS